MSGCFIIKAWRKFLRRKTSQQKIKFKNEIKKRKMNDF